MRSMTTGPAGRLACGLVLGLLAAAAVGASAPWDREHLPPVWRAAAQSRFSEAEKSLPADAADEEARFTQAVLRFNRQPRTSANMDAAISIFTALATEAATPERRARSLYFWARSEDLRRSDDASGPALKLYERLWREYPEQPFGQRALVHCLLHAFYSNDSRDVVLARCAALEQSADGVKDSTVRCHFHQAAARGYLHLGGAEAMALKHLLAVEQLGVARQEAWGDLQVSIGQIGAQLGQPALARAHYAAFLQKYPHDPRAFTVRALLAALPVGGETAP